ncbi:cation/H(+) antiporter 15-like [Gastrolobium bilobum]|uniref:cation/H(+) antiporter 15-like n=1 Tax=Gastrolobium bilobum TaxID=150636 RepID=UPI002AB1ADD0|nr:cation/H(+) antiporter 15-like [Gastrolobium bilobum]
MDPVSRNMTMICQDPHSSNHKDIWHWGNPLDSPTPVLFMQVSLITIVTQIMDVCLKPLGQSSLVSQILGGLIFGPSLFGHKKVLSNTLFPIKGAVVLETLATFGIMFFYFIYCVKIDIVTMLRTERQALAIGISVFSITLGIPTGFSFLLKKYVSMEKSLADSLTFIAVSQSLTAFVVISVLMAELKILNTDVGRLTMSAAMFADVFGFAATAIMFAVMQNSGGNILSILFTLLSVVMLFIVIIYVMRPVILWILERSKGKPVDELHIVCIFVFVLISGFLSEFVGQHFIMGPLVLGLAVPEGPPLGTALITKMETVSVAFLYPIYLAVCGLETDIFKIRTRSLWVVSTIVLCACFMKIGAVILSGYYYKMPLKESCVIGILLNARGIAELSLYNIWRAGKVITGQEFSLLVISILVINAIISPLIKFLYDPSDQYHNVRRCSIQHTKRESELRVMVCIHNNENIPTIINLLEASYASRESTVAVIALVLVELLGRARPILVAHQAHDTLRSTACNSTQIDNSLRQYAQQNEGCASVQSFTSVSLFDTMHDDVCRISLDMRANLLIMPFHKRWEIDGTVQVANRAIQTMNIKVLEKAPCSVGILIDRGILCGSQSLLIARAPYRVAVLFIGGADDAETLAYGTRMARHENVNVTVIRFLLFGDENSKDRKRDSDIIGEYRYYNAGNRRFEIMEEVVKDGIEMSSCVRKLIDYFDLVMVGREHPESVLLRGHDQWSECPELGVIGDMIGSQDFVTKASVLVVQQQRIRGRLVKHTANPMPNQRDQLVHDVPFDEVSRASCTISVDRHDQRM